MDDDAFHVSLGNHLMSGAVHHACPLWRWLGNAESWFHRSRIEQTPIAKPIYVAGLARSGTSVLIEILASHPDVATHQYRDFPFLFIPYWWRETLNRSAPPVAPAQERAHGDRLMVTPQSPEAMEEVLWMAYFRRLHQPYSSSALDGGASNPRFERFYRDHIRKLLLIAGRTRYAAKGNYNLTRLEYLLRLFPDARFILPVRRPREHIASLMKQHRLFNEAAKRHPRSVAHLDRVGHFEFGAHRRCISTERDSTVVKSIEALWRQGDEVRGWARYWASLYRWVTAQLASNESLRRATLVMRYEDLCDRPQESLGQLLRHCALPDESGELTRRWAPLLSRPSYYEPTFTPDQERAITEETERVAVELGYDRQTRVGPASVLN
jgi:Sulfotransferase family